MLLKTTYYVKIYDYSGSPYWGQYGIELYTDSGLTSAYALTSATGTYGAGTMTWTVAPSVTDREYKFRLQEQEEKLELITIDATPTTTTLVEFSEAITEFKNRVKLKSHTSAEILALTGMTVGEMVYNTTDDLIAYYDGDWRNIAQGALIT